MAVLKRVVAAVLLLLLLRGGAAAQTEQRVALVVGNGNYLNVANLSSPANDARAMAAMLRRVGFEVIERENVSRRDLAEATQSFASKLAPGGVALVYYAGHGIQTRGHNYLVPVDADLAVEDDVQYEAVDLQDILDKLDDAKSRLSMVFLDACRDNPFSSFRSSVTGLAAINPSAGTVIVFSTSPGKVARDGHGETDIFTAELVRAMSKPDKLADLLEHVSEDVQRQTGNQQMPWTTSSFQGEFSFAVATAVTTATPTVLPAPVATSPEAVLWQSIAGSSNAEDFLAFLQQFPAGSFAASARSRLASLATSQGSTRPPTPAEQTPREVKYPAVVPTSSTKQKSVPDPTDSQRPLPALEDATPAAPTHSEPATAAPLVARQAPKKPMRPSVPPAILSPDTKAAMVPATKNPAAQEAMVRPLPESAESQRPPAAVQPDAPVSPPTEASRAPSRAARSCKYPYFNGVESGAGGYQPIRIINDGSSCRTRIFNPHQPTQYSLSLSKPPSHGSVTIEGNAYYYTPSPGYVGSDEFSIVTTPWGSLRAVVTVLPPGSRL